MQCTFISGHNEQCRSHPESLHQHEIMWHIYTHRSHTSSSFPRYSVAQVADWSSLSSIPALLLSDISSAKVSSSSSRKFQMTHEVIYLRWIKFLLFSRVNVNVTGTWLMEGCSDTTASHCTCIILLINNRSSV